MAISAKDVMALRRKTGLGMMDCKQALADAGGDMDAAIDLLRKKGLAKMDGRSDRDSSDGRIAVAVAEDRAKAVIVEVSAETDFTASNDVFKKMIDAVALEASKQDIGEVTNNDAIQAAVDEVRLTTNENVQFKRGQVIGGASGSGTVVGSYLHFTGKVGVLVAVEGAGGDVSDELLSDLCMHVAAISPAPIAVSGDAVPQAILDKEREIAKAQAIEQGKPEQIAEKMVEGKIRKFLDEHVLLRQAFIKDDKKRVEQLLPDGVKVNSFVRYQIGG